MPGARKMKDRSHGCRYRAREDEEDAAATAPGLLLAQRPEKRRVRLQAACTAFEAFLHLPHFFKGTMTRPNAPHNPEAELLRLQDTPVCIKERRANTPQHPLAGNTAQPRLRKICRNWEAQV